MKYIDIEFYRMIWDIIRDDQFLKMKNYKHHIKGNVYDHSIKVAYLCYKHHKKFESKLDLHQLVRGALLHDYYLYDWHDGEYKFHGFTHPKKAHQNALNKYPDLSKSEQDMIRRHMFPLTPIPPKTRAGWLVCFYDKVAAVSDYFGENKWKKRKSPRNKSQQ